ncbi:hypothetical protein MC7420_6875 [Coleofasciculus chthonoplastes PCC 7420]|uniref:Uncharacterized protein n=1 Tax=Coleofasciculus chthonoplastes PCC 7420 TaxID=118168 RepID=B4W1W3_9CYAN|nr:hypothetical protein MC7420_6875 [Coleofasciculus chthonoplastes PCC 7420]
MLSSHGETKIPKPAPTKLVPSIAATGQNYPNPQIEIREKFFCYSSEHGYLVESIARCLKSLKLGCDIGFVRVLKSYISFFLLVYGDVKIELTLSWLKQFPFSRWIEPGLGAYHEKPVPSTFAVIFSSSP